MPTWTIERQYLVPIYQTVVIEAASIEEACQIALGKHATIHEPDWGAHDMPRPGGGVLYCGRVETDHDNARATTITRIVAGNHDDPYGPNTGAALPVPEFADGRDEALTPRERRTIAEALYHEAQRKLGVVNATWVNFLDPDETQALAERMRKP